MITKGRPRLMLEDCVKRDVKRDVTKAEEADKWRREKVADR